MMIHIPQLVARAESANYSGPWFENVYADERHSLLERGEDLYFCRLVRQLGGVTWADVRIATDHDGRVYAP